MVSKKRFKSEEELRREKLNQMYTKMRHDRGDFRTEEEMYRDFEGKCRLDPEDAEEIIECLQNDPFGGFVAENRYGIPVSHSNEEMIERIRRCTKGFQE